MWTNSSSPCNASLPPLPPPRPPPSDFMSHIVLLHNLECLTLSGENTRSVLIVTICIVLILPLNVPVLYLSHRRSRRLSSSSRVAHADTFAFHVSVMGLMNICGSALICCGIYKHVQSLSLTGIIFHVLNLNGALFFNTLTCLERYLAVVYPITYLGLRKAKGVRFRNILVGGTWILSCAGCCTVFLTIRSYLFVTVITHGVFCGIITFCCISVLRVLNRPRLGDGVGGRAQVDPVKLRAFHTIVSVLGVLLVRVGGNIIMCVLFILHVLEKDQRCHLWLSLYWFCLPCDLVLPLLFLQRAGVLRCSKKGQGSQ